MSEIQHSINEKLDIIQDIKDNIREAVNDIAEEEIIGEQTPFTQYAQLILDNLCKCQKTTYTITFDKNHGSGTTPDSVTVNAGQSITLPEYSGTRDGYTLKKTNNHMLWCENSNGSGTTYPASSSYTPIANKTLYVVWQINQYAVTLNYGWNGTSNTAVQTVNLNYGVTPTLASFNLTAADLAVSGYTYTLPTFRPVSSNTQQNMYNVSYTAVETYYYRLDNGDNATEETPIQADFSLATSTTSVLTNLNLSNFDCVFVSACVPNEISKVEFQSEQLGQIVLDELFDKSGTDYDSLILFDNIPQDYKVLLFVVCGASGLENTKLKITK